MGKAGSMGRSMERHGRREAAKKRRLTMAYTYDIPFRVDLEGRVALVTGGNGGIGGMFCRALAA